MKRRAALAALALLLATGDAPVSPPPGAASCTGCHGPASPLPALAGRDPAALVAALDAYRDGTRQATVMGRIVRGFSHDETVSIAAWLAAQK